MHRETVRLTSCVLVIGALSLAIACGKKQPPVVTPTPTPTPVPAQQTPPPQPPPPPPAPAATPAPAPTSTELDPAAVFAKWTLEELNAQKPLDDVLFAYDSAELSETGRATLQKNSAWLQKWLTTKVTIEGHADSRGTNEYNFALSERRAASVRDYLVSLGVAASRLAIVSKGEEQPVCTDETESCWERNRRGHFIFTAK